MLLKILSKTLLSQKMPQLHSWESPDGHVLLLWVYLDHDKVENEIEKGDDETDEDNLK